MTHHGTPTRSNLLPYYFFITSALIAFHESLNRNSVSCKTFEPKIDEVKNRRYRHQTSNLLRNEYKDVSNERSKLLKGDNNKNERNTPIYQRRNPNAPHIMYSVKKGDRLNDDDDDNWIHHPYEQMKKANEQVDASKNRRLATGWYDPYFSLDDFLQEDWYETDDTYNPLYETKEVPVVPEYVKFNWDNYRPIRIKADVRHLISSTRAHAEKSEFLEYTVIPAAIQFWTRALMVFPVKRLFVDNQGCELAPYADFWNGITGVDLMIYVEGDDDCSKGGTQLESFAGARSCDWDQYERPIGGYIKFCYDSFTMDNVGLGSEQLTVMIDTVIHEIGHVLGLGSEDMMYYYDRLTGKPRTPQPWKPSEDTWCVSGKYSNEYTKDIFRPHSDTLRLNVQDSGVRYYEIVTPTVKQVAQNHYNCDRMEGLRLENQPTSDDCYGQHWDERFAWDENMSAMLSTRSVKEHLSPFTLALLEDTGWYRANFSMAEVITFGHNASCDFVEKPCIVDNAIPEYSKGYFCNSTDKINDNACDPSRTTVAFCDLYDLSQGSQSKTSPIPDVYQYFDNPSLGAKKFQLADFCPMYIQPFFTCKRPPPNFLSKKKDGIFADEVFGENSFCIDSNFHRPLCMEITCDDDAVMVHLANGSKVRCSYDGEKINISDSYHFECPRRATVCPNSICPANCSGRGICQWNLTTPKCKCFDEEDTSKNCNDYRVGKTSINDKFKEEISKIYHQDENEEILTDEHTQHENGEILTDENEEILGGKRIDDSSTLSKSSHAIFVLQLASAVALLVNVVIWK